MLGVLISSIASLGSQYLENKKEKSKAKAQQEVKLIEQAGSWEEIHAKNSGHSWKDEYWTVVFSIPLILCFFPPLTESVMAGFAVLEQTPEWYRYTVGVLVGASVGIRQFTKFKMK